MVRLGSGGHSEANPSVEGASLCPVSCLRYWSQLGTLRASTVAPGRPTELTATSRCSPGIAPLPSVFRAGTAALRGPHPVTAYSRSPPHVVFLAKPGSGRTVAPPAWNATIVASHGRLHPPQLFRQSLDAVAEHVVVGVRPWLIGHPVGEPCLLRVFLTCRFGYP